MISVILQRLKPTSMHEVNSAWTKVWHEVDALGFSCKRLAACQVYLELLGTACGYQWFGERDDSKHCGDILLPRISLSRWGDCFLGRLLPSPVDVLRHEYGHAYADVNRRRIEMEKFEQAFGCPHEWWKGYEMVYDPDFYVTEYAAITPGEDFAEVFWLYLKHRGILRKSLINQRARKSGILSKI